MILPALDVPVSRVMQRETGSAWVAQLVERVLGKDEVTGSIPVPGSSDCGGCELVAMKYGGWMKQQGKRI